jgi:tetratricopeptide (TPR) repeat protein
MRILLAAQCRSDRYTRELTRLAAICVTAITTFPGGFGWLALLGRFRFAEALNRAVAAARPDFIATRPALVVLGRRHKVMGSKPMGQGDEGQSALEAAERLLQASRYRAACSAFASLADTDGHRAAANLGWGQALAGLENYDEAASHFDAAIDADPAADSAFDELSNIWKNLSQRDALLARIQQRIDAIKAFPGHTAWAVFLSANGIHQRALAEYDRVARAGKHDADFLLKWGEASAGAGLHEQALKRYGDAIRAAAAEGRQDLDFGLVADSLSALGAPDHELARIQACVDSGDNPAIRLQWAQALLGIDRAAACAAQIEQVTLAQPANAEAWLIWGNALVASGAKEDAMLKIARAIELDASNNAGYAVVAGLMRESTTVEADIARIQSIVDKAAIAPGHNAWAETLADLGRAKLAVAQFEAAHRISPADVSTTAWADALEQLGRICDAAIQRIRSFENRQRRGARRNRRKLLEMLRSNQLNDSDLATLQEEVDRTNSATTYAVWGSVLIELNRNADALERLERGAAVSRREQRCPRARPGAGAPRSAPRCDTGVVGSVRPRRSSGFSSA